MPLAVVTSSGTTPSCSQANQSPVRQNPVWISSAMSTIPLPRQNSASPGRNPSGGTTNPPSPWIGSMITAATLSSPTWVWIRLLTTSRALGRAPLPAAWPAQRVRHRHPVDLVGERAEPVLVRHVLGGQRHREVGAAVVGVVEDDDGLPAGGVPGDLDRVLHGLGAGVEQRRALVVRAGRQPAEFLADLDVALVRRDHEAGMGEPRHLLGDPRDLPAGRRCPRRSRRCRSRSRSASCRRRRRSPRRPRR